MSNGYLQNSGFGRDSLIDALDRIEAVETALVPLQAALANGTVVAHLSGTLTGTGLSTSFTVQDSENLTLVSLTSAGINFNFGAARPNAFYTVVWNNTAGSGTNSAGAATARTATGFRWNTFTATGAAVDPRSIATTFSLSVIDNGI